MNTASPRVRGQARRRWHAGCTGLLLLVALGGCGGGGGGESPSPAQVAPAPAVERARGRVTFDYVPSRGGELRYGETEARPARGVTVEVVEVASGQLLASASTGPDGRYDVAVPAGSTVRVRVKAELRDGLAPVVQVRDNTQGDALYALQSDPSRPSAGPLDLHAASGWTGAAYEKPRSAAPFAILDVAYRAQSRLREVDPSIKLPPLPLFWSVANKPTGKLDPAKGELPSTFFTELAGQPRIYVLGMEGVNTDEYDESVIAHEWGHYYQWAFSRDDSRGGAHRFGDLLDMSLAFSEGWGNAWSGLALGRSDVSDAQGPGQAQGFAYSLADAPQVWRRPTDLWAKPLSATLLGWYSEHTVAHLLWSLGQSQGVAPVHVAMTTLRATPAWTSIFAFGDAVRKTAAPATVAALDDLLMASSIQPTAGGAYGEQQGLSAAWQDLSALSISFLNRFALPPYKVATLGAASPTEVCVANNFGYRNKLAVERAVLVRNLLPGAYEISLGMAASSTQLVAPELFALSAGQRRQLAPRLGTQVYDVIVMRATDAVFSLGDRQVTFEPAGRDPGGIPQSDADVTQVCLTFSIKSRVSQP